MSSDTLLKYTTEHSLKNARSVAKEGVSWTQFLELLVFGTSVPQFTSAIHTLDFIITRNSTASNSLILNLLHSNHSLLYFTLHCFTSATILPPHEAPIHQSTVPFLTVHQPSALCNLDSTSFFLIILLILTPLAICSSLYLSRKNPKH